MIDEFKTDLDADGVDGAEGDGGALKDGMLLTPREDGRLPDVPEGYTVVQGDGGALLLRKKRQRNLQKLGIGGFQVRRPWARVRDKEEDAQDGVNPPQNWVIARFVADARLPPANAGPVEGDEPADVSILFH